MTIVKSISVGLGVVVAIGAALSIPQEIVRGILESPIILGWCVMMGITGYVTARLFPERGMVAIVQTACIASLSLVTILSLAAFAYGSILQITIYEATAGALLMLLLGILFATGAAILAGNRNREQKTQQTVDRIQPHEVAALIPAHNEELTIEKTINSLKKILPAANIHIGSDASTDKTVAIARNSGATVLDIRPNRGKAGVLQHLIEHFNLCERFKAIIIIDADTEIDEHYLEHALPLFDDPSMGAVAGHVRSKWRSHILPRWSMFTVAYRVRLYRFLQATMRYGQTWKYTNVTTIVPGFCSMYRTSALRHINVAAKGLIIEDYNMTFELHHKQLGKVAYSPRAIGYTQDPFRFRDYVRQVKRWNLGFWQTVRRHGFWPGRFWTSLIFFIAEGVFFSILFLATPLVIALLIANGLEPLIFSIPGISHVFSLSPLDILIGLLVIDYGYTVVMALVERKPHLLIYGLGFIVLRYIDAWIFLYTIYLAFSTTSSGRWVSPMRQASA